MNALISEDNALNVARVFEFLDGGSGAALTELVAPAYLNPETRCAGVHGVIAFRTLLRRCFGRSAQVLLRAVVADGAQVAVRWVLRGRHVAEFNGVRPSGVAVELSALSMFRLEDGRIVNSWTETSVPLPAPEAPVPHARARSHLHLL